MEDLCREHFRIYYFRVKTCILRDLLMRLFLCQDLVVRILVFNYCRDLTMEFEAQNYFGVEIH